MWNKGEEAFVKYFANQGALECVARVVYKNLKPQSNNPFRAVKPKAKLYEDLGIDSIGSVSIDEVIDDIAMELSVPIPKEWHGAYFETASDIVWWFCKLVGEENGTGPIN